MTPSQKIKCPRGILFDYDGVLVSSEPIHLRAWLQLMNELGLPQDSEIIERMVGKTAPQIIGAVLDRYRPGWTIENYDPHALARRKNEFYLEFAQTGLHTYPEVPARLQWLKERGTKIAVVSNARKNELTKTMKLLQIFDFFDEVVSRDDVPQFKPDPTPYLFGAAALGLEPTDCIAVEDSPTGLEAALKAGVPSVAVTTNFTREMVQSPVPGRPELKPKWIFASVSEFLKNLE